MKGWLWGMVSALGAVVLGAGFLAWITWLDLRETGATSLPRPAPVVSQLVDLVHPFLGSGGFPHQTSGLFPGPSAPFGVVKLSPDTTDFGHGLNLSRYLPLATGGFHLGHQRILGFSHYRLSGAGQSEGGLVRVLPGRALSHRRYLQDGLSFVQQNQKARAGSYSVDLPSQNALVELTANRLLGVHRYTFWNDDPRLLFIDFTSHLSPMGKVDGRLRFHPGEAQVTASIRSQGGLSKSFGGLQFYVALQLPDRVRAVVLEGEHSAGDPNSRSGSDLAAHVRLHDDADAHELQVAISFVSEDKARLHLRPSGSFDEVRQAVEAQWQQYLSKVQIRAEPHLQRLFYTALYRTLLQPVWANDVDGQARLSGRRVSTDTSPVFYDFSWWDTVRTLHPLHMLLYPQDSQRMLDSISTMFAAQGKLLRWQLGYQDADVMQGLPIMVFLADALAKGYRVDSIEQMLDWLKKLGEQQLRRGTRTRPGYFPMEFGPGAVSHTVDWSWTFAAAARIAEHLNLQGHARLFRSWAQGLDHLWDSKSKRYRGRYADGRWSDQEPGIVASLIYRSEYIEGTAVHWQFGHPLGVERWIERWGSKDELAAHLERFFRHTAGTDDWLLTDGFWFGNEHNWHALNVFLSLGHHDRVSDVIRQLLIPQFHGVHHPGQDDGGAMSAWLVWMALGLVPAADTPHYWLTAPLVQEATLAVGGPTPLHIKVKRAAATDLYIADAQFQGQPVGCPLRLSHDVLIKGGELLLTLGPRPIRCAAASSTGATSGQ